MEMNNAQMRKRLDMIRNRAMALGLGKRLFESFPKPIEDLPFDEIDEMAQVEADEQRHELRLRERLDYEVE